MIIGRIDNPLGKCEFGHLILILWDILELVDYRAERISDIYID